MTTLFISDLHLDDSRPEATRACLQLLEGEARTADALYILGDLFEYWLGDDAPTAAGQQLAVALAQLTQSGVPCHFVHGNRDFLLGADFARRTGMQLLDEETVVDLYGCPTLLLHGDSLCTDDVAYQQVRRTLRNPAWQAQFLSRTPAERLQVAHSARELSAEHKAGVAMSIMDVNAEAVAATFARNGVRNMIHGHTHRPCIHQHELAGASHERIVLGDWYEQGSVLRVSADARRLENLPLA